MKPLHFPRPSFSPLRQRTDLSEGIELTSGFPSPAEDYVERPLDLNAYLIRHPAATFFIRARGDALRETGIHDGDLLIVDRALRPLPGGIVVAVIESCLTLRRVIRCGHRLLLTGGDGTSCDTMPAPGDGYSEHQIWGVVTHVLHELGPTP